MIKTISDYMIQEIYGIGNSQKLFLYSGKGNNIISLLYAYGLYKEPHFPKSSSALIFELLSDKINDYVKVNINFIIFISFFIITCNYNCHKYFIIRSLSNY